MAKLMWIAGIVLVAVGVALGLMVFFSPASIVSWGVNPETVSIIIVGGIVSLGLGGVINALEMRPVAGTSASASPETVAAPANIPEFGRRAAEPVAAAAAVKVSSDVQETIEALEQAKQDIRMALEERPEPGMVIVEEIITEVRVDDETPAPEDADAVEEAEVAEDVAEEPPAAEEEIEEGQLYVVEERVIRNRPARILSDGTVEAETEEGWMRFENLEHLDEYLEAMGPTSRA